MNELDQEAQTVTKIDFNHSNHPGSKNTKPDAFSNLFPEEKPLKNPSLIVPSPCVVGTWGVGTYSSWHSFGRPPVSYWEL